MKEKLNALQKMILKKGKYIFPVVICLAVAVTVVIALKSIGVRKDTLDQIGETISEPQPSSSVLESKEDVPLVENDDPAVHSVIASYYNAIAEGDEETILKICDKVGDRELFKYRAMAQYIDNYPVLDIYTKPGWQQGDVVAFIYFKLKFTGKDAEIPGYGYLYLCKNEDDSYFIKRSNHPEEGVEYLKKISSEADVLELENRTEVEFNELMKEQPDLLVYMSDVDSEVSRVVGEELAAKRDSDETQEEGGEEQPEEGGASEQDVTAQNSQPADSEPVYATASTTVNVRKSDSEKSEKIGKVAGGTKVQVLETLVNGWTKISYENSEGYIMSKFLKVQESAQKYTIIGKVKATDNINVRAESSTDSAKMGTLVSGDTADLIAEEGDWCKISFNGQVAYVKTEYVQKQ